MELIAPELKLMLQNGSLSPAKVDSLIRLREIVERFSSCRRISEEESALLKEKYGEEPGLTTWADYFQAETASRYFELSDADFDRITDTIRFDLISAYKIFSDKPENFFQETERKGMYAWSVDRNEWDSGLEEDAHLYVLMGYFNEMRLDLITLSDEDENWFMGFTEQSIPAAG